MTDLSYIDRNVEAVREKIEEIENPIICGGTGLYIDAAIRDYHFDGEGRNF